MRNFSLSSVLLLVCAVLIAVFLGGREINQRIEDTVRSNLESELEVLKEKLNKQGELISSMINVSSGVGSSDISAGSQDSTPSGAATGNTNTGSDKNTTTSAESFKYVKENGGITVTGYTGKLTSVVIPERIDGLPVLKIGERAFAETSVRSVVLPSSCVEVDWFAFLGCYALSTVYISGGVSEIGYGAFDSCSRALVIYCESGSYAERYARSFGIAYEHIEAS